MYLISINVGVKSDEFKVWEHSEKDFARGLVHMGLIGMQFMELFRWGVDWF